MRRGVLADASAAAAQERMAAKRGGELRGKVAAATATAAAKVAAEAEKAPEAAAAGAGAEEGATPTPKKE
jgi:hypothetical protein